MFSVKHISIKHRKNNSKFPFYMIPVYLLAGLVILATNSNAIESGNNPNLGSAVDDETLKFIDISIEPDGKNLPTGSGSAIQGETVYAATCAGCHGADALGKAGIGGEGMADPLIGGVGSLASDAPVKTVISYWPYATTLFDYTRRAMPINAPLSLSDDEVYAVSAYLLHLGGVIEKDFELNADTLPAVKMPNADGFQSVWPEE